jgi:hypothetical protein
VDFGLVDIDQRFDTLSHGANVERQPIPRPMGIDVACAAWNMLLELVHIGRNAPARLLAAQLVRQVNVDRSLHERKDEAVVVAFQSPARFDGK